MTTLSHSSHAPLVAEALLDRARRLSSHAYERTQIPTTFAEVTATPSIVSNSSKDDAAASPLIERPEETDPEEGQQSPTSTAAAAFFNLNSDCVTIEQQQSPISMSSSSSSTRPRALSLEGICEARGSSNTDDADATASSKLAADAKDHRRKHLSENGTSLMHGILAALRQNSELESPTVFSFQESDKSDVSAISPMKVMVMVTASEPEDRVSETIEPVEQQQQETNTNTAGTATSTNHVDDADEDDLKANQETIDPLATDKVAPLAPVIATNVPILETEAPQIPVKDEMNIVITEDTPTIQEHKGKDDDLSPTSPISAILAESRRAPSSSSSIKSTTSKEGKESKAVSLLHKIVRKNSVSENLAAKDSAKDSSDTNSGRFNTTHLSLHSRPSKRSSKLLGKFVPKFLHTSPPNSSSSTSSGSGGSPKSHSLFPFSTRSNRSNSIVDQTPIIENEGMASDDSAWTIIMPSSASVSSGGSQESLPLVEYLDEPELVSSPVSVAITPPEFPLPEFTPPEYLEYLRSDSKSSNLSLGRRSSCSSGFSKRSDNSFASRPSESSVSSVESAEEVTKEGENNVEEEEKKVKNDEDENRIPESTINNSALYDVPMSPYVIDEDCDDDFFLNSVLRKKSQPIPHMQSQRPVSMMMPSSYPSNWSMMHSGALTPSISHWSSASSLLSAPMSLPNSKGRMNSYPPVNPSSMHMHYRSNPLPTPIHAGLDEKRSRLRDAVSEWRRSANVSSF
ncbi:hypothetical protein BGZ65_002304 [Modicella reniformis]|uniref:Uncharacterized protein n=1 Tax=Modicella reniformis TaxID=1440133 RepID=A0A9P6M9Q5_9FUNG|nr:hypothetical protein BGZ65_002304 [Modicella reniformis]